MYNFALELSEETKLCLFERITNFMFFSQDAQSWLSQIVLSERLLENGLV
jgi:hypothetical protein